MPQAQVRCQDWLGSVENRDIRYEDVFTAAPDRIPTGHGAWDRVAQFTLIQGRRPLGSGRAREAKVPQSRAPSPQPLFTFVALCASTLVLFEVALAQANLSGRHFDELVVGDELHGLLERESQRWCEDDVLVAASSANIRELLRSERIDHQVVLAAVNADDLSLVDIFARPDQQPAPFL